MCRRWSYHRRTSMHSRARRHSIKIYEDIMCLLLWWFYVYTLPIALRYSGWKIVHKYVNMFYVERNYWPTRPKHKNMLKCVRWLEIKRKTRQPLQTGSIALFKINFPGRTKNGCTDSASDRLMQANGVDGKIQAFDRLSKAEESWRKLILKSVSNQTTLL